MNNKQFDRWKEFAKAMCFGLPATDGRKDRLWREVEAFVDHYKDEPVDGWDNEYCLCDSFCEWFEHYGEHIWYERGAWDCGYRDDPHYFYNQLRIILRASVDVVFGGCGVLGYTAGDLRQMFNGRVPRWVSWRYKRFATIPDEKQLWL